MHPNSMFDWRDREAMLAFVAETAFVHAPLAVVGEDRLRFHLSRRNVAANVEGARVLVSCLGPHSYISPDWYGTADQVPTWNYVVVECEGRLRKLDEPELAQLLDDLSAVQEEALAPKQPWSRAKMSGGRFEAMLRAIEGYELTIEALRGSRKLGQNKDRSEMAGACAALRALGQHEIAGLMEESQQ